MPRLRVAYVDTETTGLSAYSDRIVEIAIVLAEVDWDSGEIIERLDQYSGLQDPGRRIPRDAIAVHGITDEMVRGKHIDCRKAIEMLAAADISLAHNSGFDKGFVAQVVPEAPGFTWGCTCRGIPWKRLYPGLGSTSLQTLSSYFGAQKGAAHRALGDVETTMNLVGLPGVQGGRSFQQLLLHKKIRREGWNRNLVAEADQALVAGLGTRPGQALRGSLRPGSPSTPPPVATSHRTGPDLEAIKEAHILLRKAEGEETHLWGMLNLYDRRKFKASPDEWAEIKRKHAEAKQRTEHLREELRRLGWPLPGASRPC